MPPALAFRPAREAVTMRRARLARGAAAACAPGVLAHHHRDLHLCCRRPSRRCRRLPAAMQRCLAIRARFHFGCTVPFVAASSTARRGRGMRTVAEFAPGDLGISPHGSRGAPASAWRDLRAGPAEESSRCLPLHRAAASWPARRLAGCGADADGDARSCSTLPALCAGRSRCVVASPTSEAEVSASAA